MDIWYSLNKALRPLFGRGLSRLPGVGELYSLFYNLLSKDSTLKMQGMEWKVNRTGDISAAVLALRHWEPFEMGVFLSGLKPGMTVVDVGASFGFYTCLAARSVGPSGKVYAFEPYIPTYNLLVRNIERNILGNVTPSSKAVSNTTGWIDTYINRSQEGVTSSGTMLIQVPCVKLDDILTSPIDVVKIDAEGHDLHVIQGMEKIISENEGLVLFVEVAPKLLECTGASMDLLLRALEKNFVLYLIKERHKVLELVDSRYTNVERECSGLIESANLYCKRKT